MPESLAWPLCLGALVGLPLLALLHRRARPAGERPFSPFFLLPASVREGLSGRRFRAPWLFLARALALVALTFLATGPQDRRAGTLVLATGPAAADPTWETPLTVVRAGTPPAVVPALADVAPVAGPPDWSAAILLGRSSAPLARVVAAAAPPSSPVRGAGAAVAGLGQVALAVESAADVPAAQATLVDATGRARPLALVAGLTRLTAPLPPGGALVQVAGAPPFPLCVPDARPIPTAEAGWPPEFEDALAVLADRGLVVRTPLAAAVWRAETLDFDPSPDTPEGRRWAPFAADRETFRFPTDAGPQAAAALVAAGSRPAPGAVVRHFYTLPDTGDAELLAGESVAVDRLETPAGVVRRFGFRPADSDFADQAGFPVELRDAALRTAAARARCRIVKPGRTLEIQADAPVTVTRPDGTSQSVPADAGRAVLTGLDQPGLYRLASGGVTAFAAVQPGSPGAPSDATAAESPVAAPGRAPPPGPVLPLAALALGALLLALVLERGLRRIATAVTLTLAFAAAVDPRFGAGDAGPVVVAVDTSGSMPRETTRAAVDRLSAALEGRAEVRFVFGDVRVRGTTRPDLSDTVAKGGDTRATPLLAAAAELAGPAGAIVYVSDGAAPDLPVATPRPVFPLPVTAPGADVAVLGGRAERLGDVVLVRARLLSDRAVTTDVEIDRFAAEIALEAGVPRTFYARVRPAAPDRVKIRVQAHDDSRTENDTLIVPIEGPGDATAAAVGVDAAGQAVPSAWLNAAGFNTRALDPDALGSDDPSLWGARVLALHDVPSDRLAAASLGRLSNWVRAGGLLLLSGRTHAFGAGGWAGTRLETLSPVTSDARPPGAGRLAVALLLDRSGSMDAAAGGIGPEAVGALARSVAAGLRDDDDRLCVLAFGIEAETLLPPVAPGRLLNTSLPVPAITRGGTLLRPALRAAMDALAGVEAESRVVVVITDGKFADGGESMPTEALRGAGIHVLAVLVGEEIEPSPLEGIARATGGAWIAGRAGEAVRLVAAGVGNLAAGGLLAGPGPVAPGTAWGTRIGGAAPAIAGRVRVRERPQARVLARVDGEPLLAEWQVGAGRVVALATDAWGLAAPAWATLLSPGRTPAAGPEALFLEDATLIVTRPPDAPPPGVVEIATGPASGVTVTPHLVAPGRFEVVLPASVRNVAGPLTARLSGADGRSVATNVFARPLADELRPGPVDAAPLVAEAALTGGHPLESPEDLDPVLAALGRGPGAPLYPILALLAVLTLLWDAAAWAGLRRPRLPSALHGADGSG